MVAVVEVGSWGTGLPFQALEEAMKRRKEKSLCYSTKSNFEDTKHLLEGKSILNAQLSKHQFYQIPSSSDSCFTLSGPNSSSFYQTRVREEKKKTS